MSLGLLAWGMSEDMIKIVQITRNDAMISSEMQL